ncbi:MAG TPA: type II secretion system protein GspE, partial [Atribacterota bacterium]|nr:type II secretion system protein GspE [Atribacterota bacterium]
MEAEEKKNTYLSNLRLGEILIKQGVIKPEQLKKALDAQKTDSKKKIGDILISQGIISQKQLNQALQHVFETDYIELGDVVLDPEIISLIPKKIAVRYKLIPLNKENNTLTLAMANPLDVNAIDYIKEYTKLDVIPKFANENEILNALSSSYEAGYQFDDLLDRVDVATVSDMSDELNLSALEAISQEAPIIQLVNMVIVDAIKERASDIHLEPNQRGLLVR